MKNLLKLSLLLTVLVVGGLNAGQHLINGEYVVIPDEITIVNDTGADAIVDGRLYAAGSRYKMGPSALMRLRGSIPVKQGLKVGSLTYRTYIPGQMLIGESYDSQTINLSDAFAPEAR